MANAKSEDCGDADHWYLVDTHGQRFKLPKTMLFMGRDECDVVVTSQSVDKRHAILAYDLYLNRFKLKDLSTTNGTFVNNCRIPDQEYVSLNHMDSIRLGQEAMMYHIEQASQINQHGGQVLDPLFIPSWASRASESPTIQVLPHPYGECQLHYIGLYGWFPTLGCIAEQNLQHTCHCRQDGLHGDSVQLENLHHLHQQHFPGSPHTVPEHQEYYQPQTATVPLSQDSIGQPQHQQLDQVLEQPKLDDTDFSGCRIVTREEQTILTDDRLTKHWKTPSPDLNIGPDKGQFKHEESCQKLKLNSAETSDSPESQSHDCKDQQTTFFVPLDNNSNSAHNIDSSSQRFDHSSTPAHSSKHRRSLGDCSVASTRSLYPGLDLDKPETARSPSSTDQHVKSLKGSAYMEIPLYRDYDSCTDFKKGPTASNKYNSSLIKENVLDSPSQKQPEKTNETQSPGPEMNPATSFTIELTNPEQPTTKTLTICSSISQFVPPKMRKSFQGRKNASSKASKKPEELEPTTLTQSKTEGTVVGIHGKTRLAGTSLRPANLEEISLLCECSERRSSLDREMEADKKGPVKKPGSSKSYQAPQPPQATTSSSTSVNVSSTVSDYHHPTNYLFDKMFNGRNSHSTRTGRQHYPENHQPKASLASQDKVSCLSTEISLIRPVIDPSSYQVAASKINHVNSTSELEADNDTDPNDDDDDLQIIEDIPSEEVREFEEKDDREDKVSEAGTYTIEADLNERQEEEDARRRIDEVFGVDDIDVEHGQDVTDSDSQPHINDCIIMGELAGNEDTCDDSENTLLDNSSSHSLDDDTDDILPDFDDNETNDLASTNIVPTWVSQLTSLATQKSTVSNKADQDEGAASLSKKPPQSVSRKRSGTGRKLPSIPYDKSSVEHMNNWPGKSLNHLKSGVPGRHNTNNNTLESSISLSESTTDWCPASPDMSTGSCDNENTELPLGSHVTSSSASLSYRSSQTKKVSKHYGSDPAGSAALVNAGENFVTPVLYNNPRDALAQRKQKDWSTKPGTAISTPAVSLGKKLSDKLISPTSSKLKVVTSPRSTPPFGVVQKNNTSNVFTRKDSFDNCSTTSDLSSETGDGSLSRCSSKGKTTITMTRTNKTFHLRRAQAGSLEEPTASRSRKAPTPVRSTKLSLSKPGAASTAERSHGGYCSSKGQAIENTSHAETAGMVTQVVKKSQNNTTHVNLRKAGSTVLSRTDSGIHGLSLKLQRASSLTITHLTPGGKGEYSPKSNLRSTPTNRSSLTMKGISSISSKSHSQPGSRSSSPKMAEKMAWKRRKEYDARKSVAEARVSKTKDISVSGITMRLKPAEDVGTDMRMIRSASFTNSSGVSRQSLCLDNAVGTSQDFTHKGDFYHQHYDLRKAFLPFHNSSHHNGGCSHSADEDDSIASTASVQDSAKSLVSLLEIPSAFTPPLIRNKQVPPESSSPYEASLSLRRLRLNMNRETSVLVTESSHASRDREGVNQHSQQTVQSSYDSVIAASVNQLSQKLTRSTLIMLNKLRKHKETSQSSSPDDVHLSDSIKSDMTVWEMTNQDLANQELAGTLKNLRLLERHLQMINMELFPGLDSSSDLSLDVPVNPQGKEKLLEDIERNLGFHPIDQPQSAGQNDLDSPEMLEISGQF